MSYRGLSGKVTIGSITCTAYVVGDASGWRRIARMTLVRPWSGTNES